MPEYLTPGVYVEETSFRSRSIEGVATSTFGMAGLTRYGPVPFPTSPPGWTGSVAMTPSPTLVTSFTEFERAFGGLEEVGASEDRVNYLGHAARAFFANGGRRLYVSRVFPWKETTDPQNPASTHLADENFAGLALTETSPVPAFRSRWPGIAGNEFAVSVSFQRGKNVLKGTTLIGVGVGAAVEVFASIDAVPKAIDPATKRPVPPDPGRVRRVGRDTTTGAFTLVRADGTVEALAAGAAVCHLTATVTVRWGSRRSDSYPGLELSSDHPRSLARMLQAQDPADDLGLIWFDAGGPLEPGDLVAAILAKGLDDAQFLRGATEDEQLAPSHIAGLPADPDDEKRAATGLAALAEVEDIAIVSSPDAIRFTDPGNQETATNDLITHCEAQKAYRIGIVDPPKDSSLSQVREFRAKFDSKYTALYYPWMDIMDPTARPDPGTSPATVQLPPSGFVAGIYARSDVSRGVHKAPANEVILGMTGFRQNVTFDRQSVLNPEGINALRFFDGRANRVWGARTMSSDPEWKYVNVRRLFLYLEHSIDRATQWAVFEPNNERLWASIRQSIADFLVTVWNTGGLMGTSPEEAFFVHCDRTTMTQNDLDNGRMICNVGVAPTYPAEFVIFRVGQWTADAQRG